MVSVQLCGRVCELNLHRSGDGSTQWQVDGSEHRAKRQANYGPDNQHCHRHPVTPRDGGEVTERHPLSFFGLGRSLGRRARASGGKATGIAAHTIRPKPAIVLR